MTDEEFDWMVRAADPYRPEVIAGLDGAEQTLLEQIVSEDAARRRRLTFTRRLAGAIATAAAVTGVLAVAAVHHQPDSRAVAPHRPAPSETGRYSTVALKAAEQNPRLLIDERGWTATSVEGFAAKDGSITFQNGARELEMDWYPADEYAGYYQNRLEVSQPAAATVDGWPGDRFTYSDHDFAVMLRPRDGVFAELRTGTTGWSRASFDQVLPHIVKVDVDRWLAALPAEIVTPDRAHAAAAKVLADIPLPPGFDVSSLAVLGTNDPYRFGADVTMKVGCGWIAQWEKARRDGDPAGVVRATEAMSSSHHWRVLGDMAPEGGWSQSFWKIADGMAAGHLPSGAKETLECG